MALTKLPRLAALVALSLSGCMDPLEPLPQADGGPTADSGPVETCTDPLLKRANLCAEQDTPAVTRALNLLNLMPLEEKVQQMSGPAYNPNNMFDQESNERYGVPGFLYMDGPRGVRWYNSDYGTTVFPVAAARASTWDLELETRIGKVMADELRALGRHILLAPTINQVSHPRWGRAQETYGEDSWLLGEMGAAFIEGAQYTPEDGYTVQACAKHLAANNIEDTRIYVNAVVDERTLREVYLPHFEKAVDAGVACVMASYNRINGDYACYNSHLLRDILKGDWGYTGYVISDWFAKGKTVESATAGLDIELPFSSGAFPSMFDSAYFYGAALVSAVTQGQISEDLVDEAALRILYNKAKYGVLDHEPVFTPEKTRSESAQALALEAAREGMVLLKNGAAKGLEDDVLPLDVNAVNKVAIVGMFANLQNTGDKGSSNAQVGDPAMVITPKEGLEDYLTPLGKTVVSAMDVAGHEAELADADVIVVVAAYYFADLARSQSGEEGEWKDRTSMRLPDRDLANITAAIALKAQNPNLKVVVMTKSGGAIDVSSWIGNVDALLMAWFGGMKEGTALAEILFGDVTPSGKTCQSWPMSESDLPAFENTTQGDVVYDYYHGYRYLEKHSIAPRYPFGYGLSYTTFGYGNLQVKTPEIGAGGTLNVSVDVTNTGARTGSEVVQLYVGFENTGVSDEIGRAVKELKAFARVEDLAPGETRTVNLSVQAKDLAYWDTASSAWKVETMAYTLFVGPSTDVSDTNMQRGTFTVK